MGIGSVSFSWWKKLEYRERTTNQLQVTGQLFNLQMTTLVGGLLSYSGPTAGSGVRTQAELEGKRPPLL